MFSIECQDFHVVVFRASKHNDMSSEIFNQDLMVCILEGWTLQSVHKPVLYLGDLWSIRWFLLSTEIWSLMYIYTHKSILATYTNYIVVTTLIPINWPSWKCWKAQRMYKSQGLYWYNLPTLSDFQDFFHQKLSKNIAKAGYCLWCPRDRGGFAEGLAVKHEEKCKLHGKGRAA